MKFNRGIGFIGLTFIAVGGVIGSGWIFGPLITAKIAGPASVLSWALGGLGMLILALSYAEISSVLPVAGGMARLPMFSHGKTTTMVMGWTAWIGYNTAAPIETIAVLDYMAAFFPWLKTSADAQFDLSLFGMLIALILLFFFTLINAIGVNFFAKTNTLLTWFKIAIPLIIAASLIYFKFNPSNFTNYGGFMPYGWHGVFAAISGGGIVFSFIGFRHAIDMAGETKSPQFIIPFALTSSLLLCLIIYEIIQVAFIGALGHAQLLNGWSNVALPDELGPLAVVVVGLGIGFLTVLLYAGAIIGPVGAALVSTGSSGRLAYAMAENELFPSYFDKLSLRAVPLRAMVLNLIVGAVVIFFVSFKEAVALNSASIILSFSIGPIAVFTFRKQFSHIRRQFKLPFVQLFGIAGFCVASLIVYWSGWDVLVIMFGALIIGLILFICNIFYRRESLEDIDLKNALWIIPYLICLALISYYGSYGGGKNYLSFPFDELLIILLGTITFYLAVYSGLKEQDAQNYLREAQEYKEDEALSIFEEKAPFEIEIEPKSEKSEDDND
ncbi:MAG: APC family permease [Thermodesulfobacteriota bacterium]